MFVVEGADGSGKETQTNMLKESLESLGYTCRTLHFPVYDSLSSGPVRLYLNGHLGDNNSCLDAKQASLLYTVDRLCSFKEDWRKNYNSGDTILCDRYTQSNVLFQTAKLFSSVKDIENLPEDIKQKTDEFIKWLYDLEFNICGLPTPSLVFYMKVSEELSLTLRSRRELATNTKPDIHEKDSKYQTLVRNVGVYLANKLGWLIINCETSGHEMRSREDIQSEILHKVLEVLK